MAHYSVTLSLPSSANSDLPGAIDAAMAPFCDASPVEWEQGSLCDSWRIADNTWPWFWIMPGREDDPQLLYEPPHHGEPPDLSLPGHCSGGPRKLLDLRSTPAFGALLVGRAWDLWEQLTTGLSPTERAWLSTVIVNARRGYQRREDAEAAQQAFHEHPIIQAFYAAQPLIGDSSRYSAAPPIGAYTLNEHVGRWSREGYIEMRVPGLYGGADLVTLDGWWIEMDGRANHGACGTDCHHRPDAFNQARGNASIAEGKARYLQELPEDAIVVALQGHC